MGFKDIFKKSFIQGFTRYDATPENIIVVFLIAGFFALYIFFAYRLLTRRTFYSKSFNIALPALVMITAGVILTIQSSVVISLGMVGALSIVRFRTAIKDPMDLVFLFWAISTGIICGAGLAQISCVLAFILTVALFRHKTINFFRNGTDFVFIVFPYGQEHSFQLFLGQTIQGVGLVFHRRN